MPSLSLSEHWNMSRISEIANRCGLKPSVTELYVEFPENDSAYCHLSALESDASDSNQKVKQFWSLLGLDASGYRRVDTPEEFDAIIDNALALAPRPRAR
jgi:hypothetical protein